MTLACVSLCRRANFAALAVFAALLSGCPGLLFGQTESEVPFKDPIEYTPGTLIVDTNGVGTNGWAGDATSAGTNYNYLAGAVASNYTYVGELPITDATHDVVMQFEGTISNTFKTSHYSDPGQLLTNVTIDVMLQAGQLTPESQPMGDDVQAAVCVNTNGNLAIWHSWYSENRETNFHGWTSFEGTHIASDEWVRVTLTMRYLGVAYSNFQHFFSIRLNGGGDLSHPRGYSNIEDPLNMTDGGTAFICGDSGFLREPAGVNNMYFSGLSLMGVGRVDDVVVSAIVPPPPVGRETLSEWMSRYPELAGQPSDGSGDYDNDRATELEEYKADTDPRDPKSVFQIVRLSVGGSSNVVQWTGTTSSTNVMYYQIYRSGDLREPTNGWQQWAGNVPVTLTGTNVWPDSVDIGTNRAFYIIKSIGR